MQETANLGTDVSDFDARHGGMGFRVADGDQEAVYPLEGAKQGGQRHATASEYVTA